MKSGLILSADAWPLIVVRFPEDCTKQDLDVYLGFVRGCLQRSIREGIRIGAVSDIRSVKPSATTLSLRRYLADGLNELTKEYPGRFAGAAIVTDSALVRGLGTAFFWMRSNLTHPIKYVEDTTSAAIWLKELMRGRHDL